MKRDMDLVRLLLLDVEGEEKPDLTAYTAEQRTYHMTLLIEAGLVDGAVARDRQGRPMDVHAIKLTWEGHELLDNARNNAIWRKTIETVKSVGGTVSLEILKDMLVKTARECLGLK